MIPTFSASGRFTGAESPPLRACLPPPGRLSCSSRELKSEQRALRLAARRAPAGSRPVAGSRRAAARERARRLDPQPLWNWQVAAVVAGPSAAALARQPPPVAGAGRPFPLRRSGAGRNHARARWRGWYCRVRGDWMMWRNRRAPPQTTTKLRDASRGGSSPSQSSKIAGACQSPEVRKVELPANSPSLSASDHPPGYQ